MPDEGKKVLLTKVQRELIENATRADGEWCLQQDGFRDDLEILQEHGFIETRRSRGTSFIAFRIPKGTLIFRTADGHHTVAVEEKGVGDVYIRFERGMDEIVGPTFGPYELAQITYNSLRVVSLSHEATLADFSRALGGEWWISDQHFDIEMESGRVDLSTCHGLEGGKILAVWYSDIIIYSEGKSK